MKIIITIYTKWLFTIQHHSITIINKNKNVMFENADYLILDCRYLSSDWSILLQLGLHMEYRVELTIGWGGNLRVSLQRQQNTTLFQY